MKDKKTYIFFAVCFIAILSGCGNDSVETDNSKFLIYDIETAMPKVDYKISSATEEVIMYFPVVTSKAITGTELGGVAAKLPSSKGDIKVTLQPLPQNQIHYPYQNKYVSFLKYQVEIHNKELWQVNDIVTLCDTTLWIYHDSEFQKIRMDEEYLQITIIDNEEKKDLPDWNRIVAHLRASIEFELANKEA